MAIKLKRGTLIFEMPFEYWGAGFLVRAMDSLQYSHLSVSSYGSDPVTVEIHSCAYSIKRILSRVNDDIFIAELKKRKDLLLDIKN